MVVELGAGFWCGRTKRAGFLNRFSAPDTDRTCDLRFRKPLLYPLSYGGNFLVCLGISVRTCRSKLSWRRLLGRSEPFAGADSCRARDSWHLNWFIVILI